jgi:hypothetical protein
MEVDVPALMMSNTIRAASLLAAGQATMGLVPIVAAHSAGVPRTMMLRQIKVVAVGVLVLGFMGIGASLLTSLMAQDDKKATGKPTTSTGSARPPNAEERVNAVQDAPREATSTAKLVTAWGRPVNGLQAGLRCVEGKQIVQKGDQVEIEVVVRNVSEGPVEFEYLPPSRTWGTAEKSTVVVTAMYSGHGYPNRVHIHPGKELQLGSLALGHVRPKNPNTAYAARPELAPGKYQVGSENVVISPKDIKDGGWKLPTGYLDVELAP